MNELKDSGHAAGLQRVDSRSNAMCTCYPGEVRISHLVKLVTPWLLWDAVRRTTSGDAPCGLPGQ